jgi:hypothetical protein
MALKIFFDREKPKLQRVCRGRSKTKAIYLPVVNVLAACFAPLIFSGVLIAHLWKSMTKLLSQTHDFFVCRPKCFSFSTSSRDFRF